MITFVIVVLHSDLPSSAGGEWWRPCAGLIAGVLSAASRILQFVAGPTCCLPIGCGVKTMTGMTEPLAKILVVDDDDEIRSLLQVVLTREGFDVQQAKDAPAARRLLGARGDVDLIILDVMMPGEDGLSFCQSLREASDTPILMVSARSLSIDRSIGLETGADDYLPKPFERRELVARVKAILRRKGTAARAAACRIGGLIVDRARRAVLRGDEALP